MKPFLFLSLAAATAFAAVDPRLLSMVMPDAQAVSGIQADAVRSSPFGQYVISQVQLDSGLSQIMTSTGFDPRRDLHELVAAHSGAQSGLVIGRGIFQPALISSAAVQGGAISTNYRGFAILTGNGTNQTGAAAFLDSTTVLLGDVSSVKAAIDRRIAGTTFSGSLAQKAMELSAANDIWFAAAQSPAAFFAGSEPNPAMGNLANAFQAIQQTSGGVKFASTGVTVGLALVARSPQDAQSLVDVGKFFANMVQMNRDRNPGTASAATLADSATFVANGSVATVTLSLPEQQLEQLVMPQHAPKGRRAAVR
jgi:hypothetical protein